MMWLNGMMKHTLACDGLGLELTHMDLKDDDNLVEEALLYLLTNVDIEGTHDGCGHLIKHFHINHGHNVLKTTNFGGTILLHMAYPWKP